MNPNTILYVLPQWLIFSGILVMVYGWVEEKKIFRLIGLGILLLLSIYAIWCVTTGQFAARNFLTPDEVINQELTSEASEEIPLIVKIFPAYLLFIATAIFSIPAIWLEWKERKYSKLFIVLSSLVSLSGFFIIVTALKSL